jgi:hypothetical protein
MDLLKQSPLYRVLGLFLLLLTKKQITTAVRYRSPHETVIQKTANSHTSMQPVSSALLSNQNDFQHENFGEKITYVHFFRLYGGNRCCARCRIDISCTDLVMKARHCIFHVECFRCATCDSSLRKGKISLHFCVNMALQ